MEKEKNLFVRYETKNREKIIRDYVISNTGDEFKTLRGVFVPLIYNVSVCAWSTVKVDPKYLCGERFTRDSHFDEFEIFAQDDTSGGVILLGTARKN